MFYDEVCYRDSKTQNLYWSRFLQKMFGTHKFGNHKFGTQKMFGGQWLIESLVLKGVVTPVDLLAKCSWSSIISGILDL